MNEQELGDMIVRLIGDGSSFQKMLTQANESAAQSANFIEATGKRIEGFANSITGWASTAVKALGMLGVASSLQGAFQSYAAMEKGQIQLKAAIEATGNSADMQIPKYLKLAKAVEEKTLVTKGDVMAMAKQVEALGLTGDAAERAIHNAIGLAGSTGGEAQSMIRASVAMEQGNYQMLRRVLHLHNVRDESELVRIATQRIASGWAIEEASSKTASGQLEKLSRSFKGLSRELGGMVAEVIMPFVGALKSLVDWVKQLDPAVLKTSIAIIGIGLAAKFVPPILTWLTTTTIATSIATLGFSGALTTLASSIAATSIAFITNPIVLWTVAIAAAGYGIYQLSTYLYNAREDVKALNAELAKQKPLDDAILASQKSRNSGVLERAENMADPNVRRSFLQEQSDRANADLEARNRNVAEAQRNVDRIAGDRSLRERLGESIFGETLLAPARANLAALTRGADEARSYTLRLGQALAAMSQDSILYEIDKVNTKLQHQIDTWGLDADAVTLFNLRAKAGMSESVEVANALNYVIERMLTHKGLELTKGAETDLEKLMKKVREADELFMANRITQEVYIKVLGGDIIKSTMTDLDKLKEKADLTRPLMNRTAGVDGITAEQFRMHLAGDTIKGLMESIDKLRDKEAILNFQFQQGAITVEEYRKALGGDIMKGAMNSTEQFAEKQRELVYLLSRSAITVEAYIKTLGGQTTREFMTPQEKFTEREGELQQMFLSGAISAETYARALEKANKELAGMAVNARAATAAGSAEALFRMDQYLNAIKPQAPPRLPPGTDLSLTQEQRVEAARVAYSSGGLRDAERHARQNSEYQDTLREAGVGASSTTLSVNDEEARNTVTAFFDYVRGQIASVPSITLPLNRPPAFVGPPAPIAPIPPSIVDRIIHPSVTTNQSPAQAAAVRDWVSQNSNLPSSVPPNIPPSTSNNNNLPTPPSQWLLDMVGGNNPSPTAPPQWLLDTLGGPPNITNIPPAITLPASAPHTITLPTNAPPTITNVPPNITNTPPAITNIPPAITNIPPSITNIPPAITNVPPAIINNPYPPPTNDYQVPSSVPASIPPIANPYPTPDTTQYQLPSVAMRDTAHELISWITNQQGTTPSPVPQVAQSPSASSNGTNVFDSSRDVLMNIRDYLRQIAGRPAVELEEVNIT